MKAGNSSMGSAARSSKGRRIVCLMLEEAVVVLSQTLVQNVASHSKWVR